MIYGRCRRLWQGFIICAIIIILMFFFTVCENAIIEISDSKLKKLTGQSKHGKHLKKLVDKPNRLVMTNLISRAIMIIILSASATAYFFVPLRKIFLDIFSFATEPKWGHFAINLLTFFIIICILAMVITVFGLNLPKRLCFRRKDKRQIYFKYQRTLQNISCCISAA